MTCGFFRLDSPALSRRKAPHQRAAAAFAVLLLASACSLFQPNPRTVTAAEWRQVLASHRGDVLVLYVWAGWCRPCVEALPGYAELQRSYESASVEFVSLSLDDARDNKAVEQAHRILRESGTGGEHYLLAVDFAEAIEALDVPRVPAIVAYGAEGQRRATLLGDEGDNRIFPEDLKSTLDAMLGGE